MTRDECRMVEQRLVFPGAQVELQCDAYRATLHVVRDKMRMMVMVYVDGVWKGEWLLHDCQERRRFMRPVVHRPKPFTPKQVKLLGKKWCDEQRKKQTGIYYMPSWPSTRALLRHLHKHNSSVELTAQAVV